MADKKRPPLYFWQMPVKYWRPHHPTQVALLVIILMLIGITAKTVTKKEMEVKVTTNTEKIDQLSVDLKNLHGLVDSLAYDIDTLHMKTDESIQIQKFIRARIYKVQKNTTETLNFLDDKNTN